jgi:3-phosphoglycerate kinase
LDKELRFLKGAVDAPIRPFAAVVGGAKVFFITFALQ